MKFAPEPKLDWLGAEQTNSSVVMDRKAVIKLIRKISVGVHPEAEMSRFLTERNFDGTPPLLGEVVRSYADGQSATIALAQVFVDNQGDGWKWTLNRLQRAVDEGTTPFCEEEAAFSNYAAFCAQAGRRVGGMHAILASEPTILLSRRKRSPRQTPMRCLRIFSRRSTMCCPSDDNADEKQHLRSLQGLAKRRSHAFVSDLARDRRSARRARASTAICILGQLLVTAADVDDHRFRRRAVCDRSTSAAPRRCRCATSRACCARSTTPRRRSIAR